MIKIKKYGSGKYPRRIPKDAVQVTALHYLKEALLKEHYEICQDVIAIAKEFGAKDGDVRDLLEDPRRSPT